MSGFNNRLDREDYRTVLIALVNVVWPHLVGAEATDSYQHIRSLVLQVQHLSEVFGSVFLCEKCGWGYIGDVYFCGRCGISKIARHIDWDKAEVGVDE